MLQIKKWKKGENNLSLRIKMFFIIVILNTIILFYTIYNIFEKNILHNVQGSKIRVKENKIKKGL